MPFFRWIACIAPLLVGCASVQMVPETLPDEEETISLRFGWEPGERAQVSVARSVLGWTPRGPDRQEIALRYELELEKDEGDEELLLIRRRELNIDAMPAIWDPSAVEMAAMELGQPDWRVSAEGNLVGIGTPAKAQATAASLLGRMAKSGQVPESFKSRLAELFSEEGIHDRANASWDHLVGLWSGGDLEVGRVYHARDRMSVDALGNISLEMLFEMKLVGRVPCMEGEDAESCVLLELRAAPEPSQHPRLLAFVSTLFPHPASDIRIEERIEVIAEPETMRPHRFSATRAVIIPFHAVEGRMPPSFEQRDERLLTFRWTSALETPGVEQARAP